MSKAGDTMRGRKHPPDCGHCAAVRGPGGGRPRGSRSRVPRSADYSARHHFVSRERGRASDHLCEGGCQGQAAHWATIHGRAGLDPFLDYVPLCAKCHKRYDGAVRKELNSVG